MRIHLQGVLLLRFQRLCRLLIVCCVVVPRLQGQAADTAPAVSNADLQADAAILRRAYETLHPGLYRYATKAEMDANFEALDRSLASAATLRDAFLAFSVFAAKVRCGHTYTNFVNQSKATQTTLLQGNDRVPFYFRWVGGRMIVTRDFTADHRLPRGTEVLAMNGTPVQQILTKLMTIARADGANDAKRIASLQVTGDSNYEAFDVYFPLFFPQTEPQLHIHARLPGAKAATSLEEKPLTFAERVAPIKAREAARNGGSDVLFEWNELRPGIAYLRMPTWALFNSKWDWKTWLDTHMDEAIQKHDTALIVDLRGNEGGQDVGDVLLDRLPSPVAATVSMTRYVRYHSVEADLRPYLDTWDPSFNDWGKYALDPPQSPPGAPAVPYFRLTKFDDEPQTQAAPVAATRFTGKLVVLTDADNSSATFQFAQAVRERHAGVLVGGPTGGSLRGINGGAFFFLRLPHSHIELDLPLVATFPSAPQPDAGLMPDIAVSDTAEDIARGRDGVLDAALKFAMR